LIKSYEKTLLQPLFGSHVYDIIKPAIKNLTLYVTIAERWRSVLLSNQTSLFIVSHKSVSY